MAQPDDSELVRFRRTDLYVSRLCQGTAFRTIDRSADDPRGQVVLRRGIDLGVNFFDSSNAYGWGGAEEALGARTPPYLDMLPIARQVVATFGPERCKWESDCPLQARPPHSYKAALALIRDHARFLSTADRKRILTETAEDFFFRRLPRADKGKAGAQGIGRVHEHHRREGGRTNADQTPQAHL